MSQLSRNTGVPVPTIQRYRTDPYANPTISSIKPIADFFNLTVDELVSNAKIAQGHTGEIYIENQTYWKDIPIIEWEDVIKPNYDWDVISWTRTDLECSEHSFALVIKEDDFENFLKNSVLIFDPKLEPVNRDYVITHKSNQPTTNLKQLIFYEDQIYLKPPTPEFKTVVQDSTYELHGVLIQTRKDHKR